MRTHIILALGAVLGLAACGGSGGEDDTITPPPGPDIIMLPVGILNSGFTYQYSRGSDVVLVTVSGATNQAQPQNVAGLPATSASYLLPASPLGVGDQVIRAESPGGAVAYARSLNPNTLQVERIVPAEYTETSRMVFSGGGMNYAGVYNTFNTVTRNSSSGHMIGSATFILDLGMNELSGSVLFRENTAGAGAEDLRFSEPGVNFSNFLDTGLITSSATMTGGEFTGLPRSSNTTSGTVAAAIAGDEASDGAFALFFQYGTTNSAGQNVTVYEAGAFYAPRCAVCETPP